jgi:hypothetical protein
MFNQLVGCPMSLGRVELAGPLESVYKENGGTKFRTSLPEAAPLESRAQAIRAKSA